jgi:hypothetical protein
VWQWLCVGGCGVGFAVAVAVCGRLGWAVLVVVGGLWVRVWWGVGGWVGRCRVNGWQRQKFQHLIILFPAVCPPPSSTNQAYALNFGGQRDLGALDTYHPAAIGVHPGIQWGKTLSLVLDGM